MQIARDVAGEGRPYRIQCIFGETKPANQSVLRDLIGRYPQASALLLEDDFWRRTNDVVELVAGDPALVFVDPFGLAGLDFARLVDMIQRLGKVDLIINLRTPAAVRLAPRLSERISKAVGSTDWDLTTVSEVFRRNLSRACHFLPPAPLMISDRLAGRLHTELVLASRAADAYELWNDEIVKEVERLSADSALGASQANRDLNIELVAQRLAQWAGSRRTWTRAEAVEYYVVNYCGDAHTGTIRRAHDLLLRRGIHCLNPGAPVESRRYANGVGGS